jgi:hypothetical protein
MNFNKAQQLWGFEEVENCSKPHTSLLKLKVYHLTASLLKVKNQGVRHGLLKKIPDHHSLFTIDYLPFPLRYSCRLATLANRNEHVWQLK